MRSWRVVLLGEHLSGELVRVDPPLPDFVICRDGVIEGGVEVTRGTDEDSRATQGATPRIRSLV